MRALAVLFALIALALPSATGAGGNFTVFAAASLSEVFPKIDKTPRYSFAGSDQLALQIRQGAPVDVYAAASPKYPQLLYHDGLVKKPVTFATNKLIVIVPKSNPAQLHTIYDLRRPGVKIVIGDPGVPIGSYTRQLLDTLGITAAVCTTSSAGKPTSRASWPKVALGEADAGFVYVTDARPVASKVTRSDSGLGPTVDPLPTRGRQLDGAPGRGARSSAGDLEARAPVAEARGVRAAEAAEQN
jgi:molybdate transport system substrate-binding protein